MKVLVADDHELVRRGVKDLLCEQFPDVEVGEAGTGAAAFEMATGRSWDVVLLDINLPGRSGLEVLADLRRLRPRVPVLVLSIAEESEYAVRVIRMGAAGYLTKQTVGEELAAAVRKVVGGGRYISTGVAEQLAAGVSKSASDPHEQLSNREFEVMKLLATGWSVKEIAAKLGLSDKTVFTYRARLLEKLSVQGDVELARYALKHGLVE